MAEQRAHVVHLAVAGTGVSAGAIDFLHDDGRFGEAEARATEFFGNQRGEPAGFGERGDEFFGIGALLVDAAEIFGRELRAKFADGRANFLILIGRVQQDSEIRGCENVCVAVHARVAPASMHSQPS